MKLNKVAALCKQKKMCMLYTQPGGDDSQWISDGSALYPVRGLPNLTPDHIPIIFDIPAKNIKDWNITKEPIPSFIDVSDDKSNEPMMDSGAISIIHGGRILEPLYSPFGFVFIDSKYLSPLSGLLDVLTFHLRTDKQDRPYVVVKAGFLIEAAIYPVDPINSVFVSEIRDFANACESLLYLKAEREAEQDAEQTEPVQVTLHIVEPPPADAEEGQPSGDKDKPKTGKGKKKP
jgi:hypothetical protein